MKGRPNELVIMYNLRLYLSKFSPVFVFIVCIWHFVQNPDVFWAIGLLLFGALFLAVLLEGFSRRYIIIDRSGISSAEWRSRRSWSKFEACAYKNEDSRRILRIYYRGTTANILPTVDGEDAETSVFEQPEARADMRPKPERFLEIDFNEAVNPSRSLEKAFQACVRCIVADGVPHPIRPFVDDLPLKTKTYMAPKAESFALALTILSAPFLILLMFARPF